MNLHTAWIYELAELEDVVSQRQTSTVKSFLSSSLDRFRAPYETGPTPHYRAVSLVGTTNRTDFLQKGDPAFNRRFWPVAISGSIDLVRARELRDSFWAEAVAARMARERHWLEIGLDDDLLADLKARYLDFSHHDSWEDRVAPWLSTAEGHITVHRVLTGPLGLLTADQWTRAAEMRAGEVLKALGWRKGPRVLVDGCTTQTWVKNIP